MSFRANDPRTGITDHVTIYDSPEDSPGYFVVRRRMIGVFPKYAFLDPEGWCFRNLHVARAWISREFPFSRTCVLRAPCDDPHVLETWM